VTDLRTRLQVFCVMATSYARDPTPPVQHTLGVSCCSVQVATCRRFLAVTVKPFEQ
jgi:hypothetical protein